MRFTFLHAADLHLDTPFKGLSAMDEHVAQMLRDASLNAFDQLVELALQRECLFVLLAGDIYDGEERGVRAQLRFLNGLKRLSDANVKVFIAHGNHDPLGGWSAIRTWPPGVTVYGDSEVDCHSVQISGNTVANIYGISYACREVSENLALRFKRRDGAGLHIGLLHCNIGGNPEHDNYSPCQIDDLLNAGMDYWALGHVHRRPTEYRRDPWIVYPGNLQGRSSKASESGPKGVVVVEADPTNVYSVEFVPVDKARFVQTSLDVAGISDLAGLQQALEERAGQLQEENSDRLLLVRAALTGGSEIHSDLTPERLDELLGELRRNYADSRSVLYWENILDHTHPEVDLEAIQDRGDFLAEVLTCSKALCGDKQQGQEFFKQHLLDLSKIPAQLRDELNLLNHDSVLERAQMIALERLQREAGE
ncbi:MAG: metallophosphoesterase family protein [Planctomycetota bacterium]|jgi:DNA repair exonuclease SbcCD nuclease subunit